MPPLLAALLMIKLGCDLCIVEAIDLGQEWRRWQPSRANLWYAGWLGRRLENPKALGVGRGDVSLANVWLSSLLNTI
jgi:hypothetical protein